MANMSYWQFRNTVFDLDDCWEHWHDSESDLDPEELWAKKRMRRLILAMAQEIQRDEEG